MDPFSPSIALPNSTFGSQSVDVLRGLILSGALPPGSRLNEVELAESLGISRGPLREAVRQLVGERLLVSINHRGAFVKQFSPEELSDVYGVRIALETYAVRTLGEDADVATLQANINSSRELIAAWAPDYSVAMTFHAELVRLTGNAALVSAANDVQHQVTLGGSMFGYSKSRATHAAEEHQLILDALRDGDRASAEGILEAHLGHALSQALEAMTALQ